MDIQGNRCDGCGLGSLVWRGDPVTGFCEDGDEERPDYLFKRCCYSFCRERLMKRAGLSDEAQYTAEYCTAVGCSQPFLGTITNTRNLCTIRRPIYCCFKQPLQDAIWIPPSRPFQPLFTSLYEKCAVKETAGNKYEINVMENSTFASPPPTHPPLKQSYPKRPSHFSVHLKFLRSFKLSLSETVFFYLPRLFTCGSTCWQLQDVPPLLFRHHAH